MNSFKIICASLFAVLLVSAIGCAGSSTNESAGEYVDDTVITAKVKAAIIGDDDVNATEVNVETFKGVVQLSGFVGSRSAMDRAAVIAGEIEGVKSVKNDMQIK